ncbi:MAG: DDE transposase, partial [Anaerolineae bacterium]|nr:DDE transposase [Anaerolineae bacterium]
PYLKGSSGQYIYRLKGEDVPEHLQRIGKLMHRLVDELATDYSEKPAYRVLQRVFQEHFVVKETGFRPKEGKELSASSLQSPDDWEATFRQKRGEKHRGYVANVTETCNPENELQLI